MQKPHKIDDIQRASIYRSERYLRMKLLRAHSTTDNIHEIVACILFVAVAAAALVLGLAIGTAM